MQRHQKNLKDNFPERASEGLSVDRIGYVLLSEQAMVFTFNAFGHLRVTCFKCLFPAPGLKDYNFLGWNPGISIFGNPLGCMIQCLHC